MNRRPRPAAATTLLPSLGALLAAGATEGCESPACGPARVDEVRSHGPQAVRSARNGSLPDALREVAIAVGLRPHAPTRVEVAGAVPVTRPEPPIATAGEPAQVTPTPPDPPPAPEGGLRPVRPNPPPPPVAPPTRPHPPPHISGGARAVQPDRGGPF